MIVLEINGIAYDNFISFGIQRSLDTISGRFSVTASVNEMSDWPIKVGSSSRILVDGKPFITGQIDEISVGHSVNAHTIKLTGNSRTIDVVDTSMGTQSSFTGDTTFPDLIKNALLVSLINTGNEKTDIKVINNVVDLRKISETEFSEGSVGESVFDFISRYAQKLQVFLTDDVDGNIVIFKGRGSPINVNLIKRKDDPKNNILSSNVTYTNAGRFFKYIIRSQGNLSAGDYNNEEPTIDIVNKVGEATDDKIRQSRTLIRESDTPLNDEDLTRLANWEANIRRIRGSTYSCTVQGFLPPGNSDQWLPGQLITLTDDYSRIEPSTALLVNSVGFSLSIGGEKGGGGSITSLNLVDKDAYTEQANKPTGESITSPDGLEQSA